MERLLGVIPHPDWGASLETTGLIVAMPTPARLRLEYSYDLQVSANILWEKTYLGLLPHCERESSSTICQSWAPAVVLGLLC